MDGSNVFCMKPKGFESLIELLKDVIRRVPFLRFAYGAVGIAAAGGLGILDQGRAAIII
jgi:hypothetical protein